MILQAAARQNPTVHFHAVLSEQRQRTAKIGSGKRFRTSHPKCASQRLGKRQLSSPANQDCSQSTDDDNDKQRSQEVVLKRQREPLLSKEWTQTKAWDFDTDDAIRLMSRDRIAVTRSSTVQVKAWGVRKRPYVCVFTTARMIVNECLRAWLVNSSIKTTKILKRSIMSINVCRINHASSSKHNGELSLIHRWDF
jgi:hypothetical protein